MLIIANNDRSENKCDHWDSWDGVEDKPSISKSRQKVPHNPLQTYIQINK